MKTAVEKAIDQLRMGLPGHVVQVVPDADGGAYVLVEGVDIGQAFTPSTTWVGFQITWACPDPDVYPHFIDPRIRYVGTGPSPNQHPDGNLPTSMSRGALMPGFNMPAIQVSRRSSGHNPATDSPLQKLIRVLDFVSTR